ncbi:hypothetical protein [Pasteuria penetrans]|uniref:hypothetical protein n=1 Tax=Pasteuria penetrans TaxID=86005 RepID=UPI0011ECD6A0|nr:hypothetical protein [Pasteuria penetrans]
MECRNARSWIDEKQAAIEYAEGELSWINHEAGDPSSYIFEMAEDLWAKDDRSREAWKKAQELEKNGDRNFNAYWIEFAIREREASEAWEKARDKAAFWYSTPRGGERRRISGKRGRISGKRGQISGN